MDMYEVTFETGTQYKTNWFDTLDEAMTYYGSEYDKWDYASLRLRSLDRSTLRDVYEVIVEHEA